MKGILFCLSLTRALWLKNWTPAQRYSYHTLVDRRLAIFRHVVHVCDRLDDIANTKLTDKWRCIDFLVLMSVFGLIALLVILHLRYQPATTTSEIPNHLREKLAKARPAEKKKCL
ncbi:hypothetical protein Zmor_024826 [Zophobas morio]|jgi:hypothetical protein|uniref:Uncharacterized protein n=1 Tax=Zophobas morio TaxID=2755281 RepID=A0AA38HKK4_9CUCU|nr:hypothetical protein Zmor_024826 [Zophobas morio]